MLKDRALLARAPVIALGSPADTPPTGAFGLYGNGPAHTAAVTTSAAGRRLFLEYDVDGVIRTNVVGYLYEDDLDPE